MTDLTRPSPEQEPALPEPTPSPRPDWPPADPATSAWPVRNVVPPPTAPVTAGPIEPIQAAPATGVPGGTVVPARRSSNARWGIALLVTAAVLGATAIGLFLLSAGAATSSLVGYVPADSVGYIELRIDAPGDQRQNVANVLSRFPGFADQSTLGTKLDELLDQLYLTATGQASGYTRDVKPWLGDSAALAVTSLSSLLGGDSPGFVWLVNTKDPAAARTWALQNIAAGSTATNYNGVELNVVTRGDKTMLVGVVGQVLLGGDEASVRAAIDTKGASTFSSSAQFKAASAAAPGDRLVFGFLDFRQVMTGVLAQAGQTAPPSGPLSLDALPSWLVAVVRAESDAVTTSLVMAASNFTAPGPSRTSAIAPGLPATTMALVEVHDLGAAILTALQAAREAPETREAIEQLDQTLRALGGAESLVGWIGDGAIVVVDDAGPLPTGGLVIRATSAEQAEARLLQVRNLVSLFGSSLGITLRDEVHGATTITIVDLGDIGQLLGPATGGLLPGGVRAEIAVVQKGELVIIGASPSFVTAVLDTPAGASLADGERYRTAIARAGASNNGQVYLDVPRLVELVVGQLPEDQRQLYQREIAPYLAPIQAFAAAGSLGDPIRSTFVVTVK